MELNVIWDKAPVDGHVVEYKLKRGEQLVLDTGHLAGMTASCKMEIKTVPGVKNMLFGGEGLFNTVVAGPGIVWLQTMLISNVANILKRLKRINPRPEVAPPVFLFVKAEKKKQKGRKSTRQSLDCRVLILSYRLNISSSSSGTLPKHCIIYAAAMVFSFLFAMSRSAGRKALSIAPVFNRSTNSS